MKTKCKTEPTKKGNWREGRAIEGGRKRKGGVKNVTLTDHLPGKEKEGHEAGLGVTITLVKRQPLGGTEDLKQKGYVLTFRNGGEGEGRSWTQRWGNINEEEYLTKREKQGEREEQRRGRREKGIRQCLITLDWEKKVKAGVIAIIRTGGLREA